MKYELLVIIAVAVTGAAAALVVVVAVTVYIISVDVSSHCILHKAVIFSLEYQMKYSTVF